MMRAWIDSYGTLYPLDTWDDGYGPLWLYVETLGPVGIVRARTWEDAFSCVVDEIMLDADPEDPDNRLDSDGNLPECVHFRSCGVPSNPKRRSPLAFEDPNGSRLLRVTRSVLEAYRVKVRLEDAP